MQRIRLKLIILLLVLFSTSFLFSGISVTPKAIFLSDLKRSVPLHISNTGSEEQEVWIDIKYGYLESNDSGKGVVKIDTISVEETSCAQWLKPYPQRFILPNGETQTIRIVASPPASITAGEYWARIIITNKPRKQAKSGASEIVNKRSGVVFLSAVGIQAYYRHRNVTTSLEISDFNVADEPNEIITTMNLTRTGNAAYLGMQTLKLANSVGKIVYVDKSSVGVFKTFFVREVIKKQNIPAGKYTLEYEISTRKSGARENPYIQSAPVKRTTTIEIR